MVDDKPFRERHDGWTAARQLVFLARLAEAGCVTDACRAAGLSTTSARRAYKRMPEFADRWDAALASPRPVLAQAAFDRAVHGVEVAIRRNGKVVATRRRYSDGLLRFLIERGDRMAEQAREGWRKPPRPLAEVHDSILTKLQAFDVVRMREEEEENARERAEAIVHAERMRAEGKAP
ncbi:hypothetical protein [uncultured Sphingomonas sp.]|uniref:hypothetical protein n=1 Tax=uncultured Sphingomonas sp. TaxID=158754 RepID=UPI0035CB81C0